MVRSYLLFPGLASLAGYHNSYAFDRSLIWGVMLTVQSLDLSRGFVCLVYWFNHVYILSCRIDIALEGGHGKLGMQERNSPSGQDLSSSRRG
jgi:hypothetical protein